MPNYFNVTVEITNDNGTYVGSTDDETRVELIARAIVAKANAERKYHLTIDRVLNPYG